MGAIKDWMEQQWAEEDAAAQSEQTADRPKYPDIEVTLRDGTKHLFEQSAARFVEEQDTHHFSCRISPNGRLEVVLQIYSWDGHGWDVHPPKVHATFESAEYQSLRVLENPDARELL